VVAGEVLSRVLALAVRKFRRLHEDARSVLAGVVTVGVRVAYAHHHGVRDLTPTRESTLVSRVADDDRSIAKGELWMMVGGGMERLGGRL
jgi:hypothetical protein